MANILDGFRNERRLEFFFNGRVIGLMELSELISDPDDKREGTFKKKSASGHLCKDICYLHQNELEIISDPCVHEGLMLLKQQKVVRYTGASLYSFEECEYALEAELYDVVQIPVSVFDISFYNRFVREKSTSVRFIARSLLLQGILVNRNAINSRIRQSHQVLACLKQIDRLAENVVFLLPN